MTDSLRILARVLLTGTQIHSLDLEDVSKPLAQDWQMPLGPGSGAGNVNKQFDDERSLAGAASEDLNLTTLVNAFGVACGFLKVKVLAIRNKSAAQTLSVGAAASNGFATWLGSAADVVKIGPGAMALLICDPVGAAVTASTGDLLHIINSAGAACAYDIFIAGE
jgi:hypothetical protein